MKTSLASLLLGLICAALPAQAIDKIRITDTKKTIDKRTSESQQLPHGSMALKEKQVVYTFSLQRMAPDVPETVTVSWILIREGMDGRLAEAARGDSVATLPLGRAATVETAPVTLTEREWTRRKNAGSVSSSLAGYGIKILDQAGQVLVEQYEPKSIASSISWDPPKPVETNNRVRELQEKIREERMREQAEKQAARGKR